MMFLCIKSFELNFTSSNLTKEYILCRVFVMISAPQTASGGIHTIWQIIVCTKHKSKVFDKLYSCESRYWYMGSLHWELFTWRLLVEVRVWTESKTNIRRKLLPEFLVSGHSNINFLCNRISNWIYFFSNCRIRRAKALTMSITYLILKEI